MILIANIWPKERLAYQAVRCEISWQPTQRQRTRRINLERARASLQYVGPEMPTRDITSASQYVVLRKDVTTVQSVHCPPR